MIKLTNGGLTRNDTKWEIGKTVSIEKSKRRPKLCSDGVLHVYESLEQALAMKKGHKHVNDDALKIFEVEGEIVVKDYDKVGCYELTPIAEVELPDWYKNEDLRDKVFVRFACYVAMEVLPVFEKGYPNDDRPRKAIECAMKYGMVGFDIEKARAAESAAYNAIDAAYNAIDGAAARAAESAARAAESAACDIYNAAAYNAWDAAARAARAVDGGGINLAILMQKAIKDFV